jgi:hypothetical protein
MHSLIPMTRLAANSGATGGLTLSAGGVGADSGARTQPQLTPEDYEGFR